GLTRPVCAFERLAVIPRFTGTALGAHVRNIARFGFVMVMLFSWRYCAPVQCRSDNEHGCGSKRFGPQRVFRRRPDLDPLDARARRGPGAARYGQAPRALPRGDVRPSAAE